MSGFSRPFSVLVTTVLLAFSFAQSAAGQSFAVTHAKVSLVAENNSLRAGQAVMLGVLFDLEKGWHIYWVNPGDSGEPPKIQWQLPAGFQAKEIRWPTPMRLGAAPVQGSPNAKSPNVYGTVVDYGYE